MPSAWPGLADCSTPIKRRHWIDAPWGEEIVVCLADGSYLADALKQSDGSAFWRERFIDSADVMGWLYPAEFSGAELSRSTT